MKASIGLFLAVLVACSSGYLIKVPTTPIAKPAVTGHTQWVHLQKLIIPLFENVCEISRNPIIVRLAKEFNLDPTDFLDPAVITNLQQQMSIGLLPKGTIFTEFNPNHMKELKVIYEVLFNAKDFDTFYKAAAWARQNLNCALYVNAIYMAVQNRRDTEKLSIPGPYELLPNYFIDKDVILQASYILAGQEITPTNNIRDEGNYYTIDANYTALFYKNEDDTKLAYFREDIGLNSFYFLKKLSLAPWFNEDINGSFGENMYHMMKQLMARYNLERYANGFPEIDSINWDSVLDTPYDPKLIYSDGNEFAHRTSSLKLAENEDVVFLQTIENNIVTVANHMRQSGYNKTQILNHLMEILVTSDRSYETLARKLLGKDMINNGHPSVLEHYMTSLRDPMFWNINKKIVEMIDEALKILPTYTRNELYFPGVEVVNIDVKKVMTACDYFEFDVTDALKIEDCNSTFKIKIGQPRLNHKQFTIKVNVSSLVSEKGIVKIYLGPKVMPGELIAKKNLFTLLDVFEVNLKIGSNIITRSSDNMKHFSEDFMLLETIRKKVEDAEFGLDSLPLKTIKSQLGYPSRLILPKGTAQGLPLQMFVFVAPYIKTSLSDSYSRNSVEFNSAILSPGYPFDLMIEDRQLFALPNAMIKYLTVTQKSDSKVENYGGPGVTKSWYNNDAYDPSSRPNYGSKGGGFSGGTDYSVKVNEFNVPTNEIVPDQEIINIDEDDIRSPQTYTYDYYSKRKTEPFDYNAKRAQFGKKDYSTTSDYTKYRTEIRKTPDTSTPIIHILSTDKYIDATEINIAEHEATLQETQQDLSEVEVLPLPAMLKKDKEEEQKFDYKVKKTERDYKIKAKKADIDKLVKDAKSKDYTKNPTTEPIDDTRNDNNTKILDYDQDEEDITLTENSVRLDDELIDYYTKYNENLDSAITKDNNNIIQPMTINTFDSIVKDYEKTDFSKSSKESDKNNIQNILHSIVMKPSNFNSVENVQSRLTEDLDSQHTKVYQLKPIDGTPSSAILHNFNTDESTAKNILTKDIIKSDIDEKLGIMRTNDKLSNSVEKEPIAVLKL